MSDSQELSQESGGPKNPAPTPLQKTVLRRLNDLGYRTARPFGVNPNSFGGERAAACARGMAVRGWVHIDRVSERHLRYGITGAGRLVLADSKASSGQTPGGQT